MLLIAGGRGKVAQATIAQLADRGYGVRIASREPENVLAPAGCEVVAAGTTAQEWEGVLAGVERAFVYADPTGLEAFLAASSGQSVERVVLLSATGIDDAPDDTASPIVAMHRSAEQALVAHALDWTIVRAAGFATNALQWATTVRQHRRVEAAFPEAHANLIHERDIADVVALAMTATGQELLGETVEITGPQSLTQREQVTAIGAAIGEPVDFVEIPEADYRRVLGQWGDERLVGTLLNELREATGRPAQITSTVQDLTGHPARSFRQWAVDHAADFR